MLSEAAVKGVQKATNMTKIVFAGGNVGDVVRSESDGSLSNSSGSISKSTNSSVAINPSESTDLVLLIE